MIPLPIATLGRALAIASCVAVAACQSALTPSPAAVPTSIAPGASPEPTVSAPATSPPTPMSTPAASPTTTVPSKPTGVTFTSNTVELPGRSGTDETRYQVTHTVRWKAPRTEGVEIRVYGVTDCLLEPSSPPPDSAGPCLVEHTRLPSSVMALAATAHAAEGEISWIAPFFYDCAGPPVGPDGLDYHAIVLAAYNDAGHSIFAIAEPGTWWRAGPDVLIC